MIHDDLLNILVCPETRARLVPADDALLRALNEAILAGRITNRAGQRVEAAVQEGLVREDRALLYPIVDDIPVMLIDEAIPLGPLAEPPVDVPRP
jgi:uncharacterized protein YbaR (Trm112 family)